MKDKYFLDTNILVYQFSKSEKKKRKRAKELVKDALVDRTGIIGFQVVHEFLNVAVRKFQVPFTSSEARNFYLKVLKPLCQVHSSPLLYLRAISIYEENGFSWYDSLIISQALEGGCSVLFTEDLQDGRRVEGLEIRNPF